MYCSPQCQPDPSLSSTTPPTPLRCNLHYYVPLLMLLLTTRVFTSLNTLMVLQVKGAVKISIAANS